jgi:hypothetical protein
MAPQITNDVVWLTLPSGLLSRDGTSTITVEGARLCDIADQVTVESVLASLTQLYGEEPETCVPIEASVNIRGGDKNIRCWNITSDEFFLAIGLLLFVLSTNPFCSNEDEEDDIGLIEGCVTVLDSGLRQQAEAVRS